MALLAEARSDIPRGLDGVVVAQTRVSDVDGARGFYHYRGIDPTSIALEATFEDAWHLLHAGEIPDAPGRARWVARLGEGVRLPRRLRDALPSIAALGPAGSMDVLRTAVSAAGVAIGCAPWTEQDTRATEDQALRLAAMTPVLAAALWRLRRGMDPVEPDPGLSIASNYLTMIGGEVPDPQLVRALDTYLVLAADHGFCNSTFAERVVVSSGADVGAALAAAIGSLSGPLHGGAIDRVPTMLAEIGEPSRAEAWMRDRLDRGERLMGFGHAVYRTTDPRGRVLRGVAERIGGARAELAAFVEAKGIELLNERKPQKRREANVDFYAGVVLAAAGVPEELFGCTFAVARMAGWTANLLEQIADNRIFRPSARYVGPTPR